jgi:glyoxylate reductase
MLPRVRVAQGAAAYESGADPARQATVARDTPKGWTEFLGGRRMKPKIFVVQPIMPEALAALRKVGRVEVFDSERIISRPEFREGIRDADYLFTLGDTPIDEEIIAAGPRLKGIAAMAMGVTGVIDVEAATRRGIPVSIIPHYITKTTADLTMALILGVAWRLVEADQFTRAGRFRQEQSMTFLCTSLPGKTAGLIGLGRIGRELVPRLRAFELDVIYNKRNRLEPDDERSLGVAWVPDMDDVIRQSDFVIIAANYNPSTHLLFRERHFRLMKPTAFFINTGRGRIVEEPALVKALQKGWIAGAGLDVFWQEPPVGEPAPPPELLRMSNVILTPHIGSATHESRRQMSLRNAENIATMIRGERPEDVINPEVYD